MASQSSYRFILSIWAQSAKNWLTFFEGGEGGQREESHYFFTTTNPNTLKWSWWGTNDIWYSSKKSWPDRDKNEKFKNLAQDAVGGEKLFFSNFVPDLPYIIDGLSGYPELHRRNISIIH